MSIQIESSRKEILNSEFSKPYFLKIKGVLMTEKNQGKTIYPAGANIFKAFDLTPFDDVNVVILGQDPYHGQGQAMGLSFSVPENVSLPPSLKNIYKELHQEGFENYQSGSPIIYNGKISGDLSRRAEQGVLLLNSILTVRAGEAASHSQIGRQIFTDEVIRQLSAQRSGIVFLLRGSYAQSKKALIDTSKNHVLETVHPSPLSAHRGWFGCNHFRLANDYLISQGLSPINR